MATTAQPMTARQKQKAASKELPPFALAKPGVKPDVAAMRRAAEAIGLPLPKGFDDEDADRELMNRQLLATIRAKVKDLLKPIPTDDQLICVKCKERSTDATEFCPFCGDTGVDEKPDLGAIAAAEAAAEAEAAEASALVVPVPEPDTDSDDGGADEESEDEESEDEESEDEDFEDSEDADSPSDDDHIPAEVVSAGAALATDVVKAPRDTDEALMKLEGELTDRLARLSSLKWNTVDNTYEMGLLVKEIQDRQLYRARGYGSFSQFAAKELPIARQTAYQMVQIVEQFTKQEFLDVGFRKLKTIAGLEEGAKKKQLLADAKAGAPAREVERKAAEIKPPTKARANGVAKPAPAGAKLAAPAAENRVTLLTQLDGKVREVPFKDANTGALLVSAGKVTMHHANAYAEIEIGDDVFLRIAVKTKGRDLIGLTTEFVRSGAA
jgi:RNA polymerase subunit RPABC4/transcription elongation factor Spt4